MPARVIVAWLPPNGQNGLAINRLVMLASYVSG
jgi:hypothetical protein